MRPVYIYALVDPGTGEWRYVGQSNDPVRRWRWHVKEARDAAALGGVPTGQNAHKIGWLWTLPDFEPRLVVVQECVTVEAAVTAERWWIATTRKHGERLTNITDGGERQLRQRVYARSERCATPGCQARDGDIGRNKPRPMCNACSRLFKKYGDPEYLSHKRKPAVTTCKIDGCSNTGRIIGGLCGMHGARLSRNGDPLVSKRAFHDRKPQSSWKGRPVSPEVRAIRQAAGRRGAAARWAKAQSHSLGGG